MIKESKNNITIDGSQGEGGGQIFRTTLTLAMCEGLPVRIENIRAGRRKPGLLRQHLTCLRAAQEICDAQVTGAELGSQSVSFVPGAVKAGRYHFAIGSAGSTTLVLQTLLLPLLLADAESALYLEGGTHNGMAPSYDFITQCFLPIMQKMGCRVETEFERYGFYPAGGGAWRVHIYPAQTVRELTLLERGDQLDQLAVATSARIPEHVTERQLSHVQRKCYWPQAALQQRLVNSAGPGNILSLRVDMQHVTQMCEAVGERNLSAERVAGRAVHAMQRYLAAGVVVGEHLADQLVLPMALGKGGRFRTLKPSQHLLTNVSVITQLTAARIELKEMEEDSWEVSVAV